MKKVTVPLRPYPGTLTVCRDRNVFKKQHKKLMGEPADLPDHVRGRFVGKYIEGKGGQYIVFGDTLEYLAHEIAHVVLHIFELTNIDPRDAVGEPFCYMLSQILVDSAPLDIPPHQS